MTQLDRALKGMFFFYFKTGLSGLRQSGITAVFAGLSHTVKRTTYKCLLGCF